MTFTPPEFIGFLMNSEKERCLFKLDVSFEYKATSANVNAY